MRRAAAGAAALVGLALLGGPGSLAAQETHLLIVGGVGGEARYTERFQDWTQRLAEAAVSRYGLAPAHVVALVEKPASNPIFDGRSTRDEVVAAFEHLSDAVGPDDQVWIVLFGHGSYAQGTSRFNIPGRDLTAEEYADLVGRISARRVAFVNTASASGGFVAPLSAPGRVILTATRSPGERNETLFGGFFVDGLAEGRADLDKDNDISLLEAYRFARLEVERAYGEDDLILTEHSLLDDNGDGEGTREPGTLPGGTATPAASAGSAGAGAAGQDATDGRLAGTFALRFRRGGPAVAGAAPQRGVQDDPRLASLIAEKESLETQVAQLRDLRDSMAEDEYQAALEELLVQIALKDREIRALEGGP